MHIVTIVDFWQDLQHPEEKTVKRNIIEFLDHHPETMIVNACYDIWRWRRPNREIKHCDPLLTDYLKANPHRYLDVDIMNIQWTYEIPWSTYTICGFHSDWTNCVMTKPIGVQQMMIHHPSRHHDITVRWDLSCNERGKYYQIKKRKMVRRLGFPNSALNVVYKDLTEQNAKD